MANNSKCRRVLQFNEYDFRHKQALEILNQHPRRMTELVVSALLHYVSCPEVGFEYSKDGIRKIVLEVLHEEQSENVGHVGTASQPGTPGLDKTALSELGDMMNMFRNTSPTEK